MKNKLLNFTIIGLSAVILLLGSCKKDDADIQSAEDAARSIFIVAEEFSMANEVQNNSSGKTLKGLSADCYVYTPTETGFELFFDNCTGDDDITRNGTIIVTATVEAWEAQTTAGISMTFENYTHDGLAVKGTIFAEFGGTQNAGIWFKLGAENFLVEYPDGTTAIIESSELTITIALFIGIEVEGTSKGINRLGKAYTSIAEGLKYNNTYGLCPWPVEGIITVTVEDEKDIIINFDQDGEKSCDNIMLVSQKRHNDVEVTLD